MRYNRMMKERDRTLDSLRGLAALFVLIDHTVTRANYTRPFDLGLFGVALFFLISGYIMPRTIVRYPNVMAFFRARVRRLWPSYLAAFAIAALMQRAGLVPANWRVAWPDGAGFVANVFMLPSIAGVKGLLPVVWTLELEWAFYALLAVLWRAKAIPLALALYVAALALYVVRPSVPLMGVCLFLLGVCASARPRLALVLALPWLLSPVVACAVLVFAFRRYAPRQLAPVGDLSYPLYLIHLPLLWISPWLAVAALPAAWLFLRLPHAVHRHRGASIQIVAAGRIRAERQ
jgi:peptidoglycan/LPS O-acetylase OafA/YrhL